MGEGKVHLLAGGAASNWQSSAYDLTLARREEACNRSTLWNEGLGSHPALRGRWSGEEKMSSPQNSRSAQRPGGRRAVVSWGSWGRGCLPPLLPPFLLGRVGHPTVLVEFEVKS